MNSARTTNSVETALRSLTLTAKPSNKPTPEHLMWSTCRLNPWKGGNGALLPDQSGDPRLVNDFYSYTDISLPAAAPTTFNLFTVPFLPYNALFLPATSGAAITLSGSNNSSSGPGAGGARSLTYTTGASNLPVPINFTKSAGTQYYSDRPGIVSPNNYITADKARVSTMGWRLLYTGPANSCQGVVTVTSSPIKNDDIVAKQVGRIQLGSATNTPQAILDCTTTAFKIMPLNLPVYNAQGKDQVIGRPEQGLKGLVRHSGANYLWKEMHEQPILLTQDNAGANQISGTLQGTVATSQDGAGVFQPNLSTVDYGSINFSDDEWDSTVIQVANATGSFRFETWMCVEYIPTPETAVYDSAKKVQIVNETVVHNTTAVAARQPIAVPSVNNAVDQDLAP
jgi:hypothetical protein